MAHALTHVLAHARTLTLSPCRPLALSHAHTRTRSHTLTLPHSLALALALSLARSRALARSLALAHSLTLALSRTLSRSRSHSHTRALAPVSGPVPRRGQPSKNLVRRSQRGSVATHLAKRACCPPPPHAGARGGRQRKAKKQQTAHASAAVRTCARAPTRSHSQTRARNDASPWRSLSVTRTPSLTLTLMYSCTNKWNNYGGGKQKQENDREKTEIPRKETKHMQKIGYNGKQSNTARHAESKKRKKKPKIH